LDDQAVMNVLLVDDDADSMALALSALAGDPVRITPCVDAESALPLAVRHPPDLAILDLELPGLSGFEAARRLRECDATRDVPILVLSGHGDDQSRVAAYASGADCFLAKPYAIDELRAAVHSLGVRGRRLHDIEQGCSVLIALAEIVDIRCLDARGHMERSARLARAFGAYLRLDENEQLALERAGYLHDIGKVAVPVDVLNSTRALTPQEREVMEQHPLIGARICEHLATLRHVVPVIRHHHERWDGSGYPHGLRGTDIPLLARVFQVVDVYEALISERCYKPAIGSAEAYAILDDEAAGGSWDRELVEHFGRALREGWFGAAARTAG
jgi:putative two-component system response regulator